MARETIGKTPASREAAIDRAFGALPADLRASARLAWDVIAAQFVDLEDSGPAYDWVIVLPRVFACSEFLAQTARRDPVLFRALIDSRSLYTAATPGETGMRVRAAVAQAAEEAQLAQTLRRLRQREMVRLAWRDLAGRAELGEVVATLSELADSCIDAALEWLSDRAYREGGTPTGENGAPLKLVVLALGKLGGNELNFSSDVDLVFTYPEEGEIQGPRPVSHHQYFLRLCHSLIRVLHEPTPDGFVFRVDARLRPFGGSGPLALSFDAMEHYYQTHGREWERYAFIKARVCAGDRLAGGRLLARLRPFVYRRYVDYGVLEGIREMKDLIAREVERKGMAENIKLGAGGIREIEFIAQALQLIHGGREPIFQERATLKVLPLLARAGYLEPAIARELVAAYTFLRNTEHRLQMIADQQVHSLPPAPTDRLRVAYGMGYDDWHAYAPVLEQHRAHVHSHFAALLGDTEAVHDSAETFTKIWEGTLERELAARALREAGYPDPARVLSLFKGLRESPRYRLLSTEGRARLDRLVPLLLLTTAQVADPDVTIARLVHLLEAVGRRSAYFSLLIENRTALTQLVNLAAASPWVALWISQHPALLDELLDPRELYDLPAREQLETELAERLQSIASDDAERQLEVLREFRNAHLLRVAAADIGPGLVPDQVGVHLSRLAEVLLAACLKLAYAALVKRHGAPGGNAACPAPGFAVVGYGKLGSLELGYASDLDMIFLYEDAEGGTTQGPRPIPNELFFVRLAQRLIHLLTARTSAGVLYQVDTRLRPSGNAGPLVTSIAAFRRYQLMQAWTWEHQALVRARPVAGAAPLFAEFEDVRREVLCQARNPEKLAREVVEMRGRMAAALTPAGDGFHVKHARGGIVDIEFMVQYWILRWAHAYPDVTRHTDNINILEALAGLGLVPAERAQLLTGAYRRYLSLEHRLKLMERGTLASGDGLGSLPEQVAGIWRDVFEEQQDDVDGRS